MNKILDVMEDIKQNITDKEFYKHVNNTYKQIEKYSNKYLGYIYK